MQHDHEVRYARNISLPEIGKGGQAKLNAASVLVVGAGGLGSPLLLYLAAAGVGRIGIIDPDRVALSNLQRQIAHETGDVGRFKTQSAADSLSALNPEIRIEPHEAKLDESNAEELMSQYDIIADGSDNFETRFLVNHYCVRLEKTLVSAAVIGFGGQLYTFKPHVAEDLPCYQCFCPDLPPPEATPRCSESGVLGSVAGILGCWQATEVIKEITGAGESLVGSMIILDVLVNQCRKVTLPKNPDCRCCG